MGVHSRRPFWQEWTAALTRRRVDDDLRAAGCDAASQIDRVAVLTLELAETRSAFVSANAEIVKLEERNRILVEEAAIRDAFFAIVEKNHD